MNKEVLALLIVLIISSYFLVGGLRPNSSGVESKFDRICETSHTPEDCKAKWAGEK